MVLGVGVGVVAKGASVAKGAIGSISGPHAHRSQLDKPQAMSEIETVLASKKHVVYGICCMKLRCMGYVV